MVNNRGQFFLLAAVIISVIVISFGVVSNRAVVSKEPLTLFDFSYEVERETGAVLDYEIYTGFTPDANLTYFVGLLAEDVLDKNPDSDFLFIYGNNDSLDLKNYGADVVFVDGPTGPVPVSGANQRAISTICYGGSCKPVNETLSDFSDKIGSGTLIDVGSMINVTVSGYDFSFPVSQYRQVIFIIQKEVEDENFIVVK